MKKIFLVLFSICIFASCEDERTPSSTNVSMMNNYNYSFIRINSEGKNFDYEKIKLNGHNFLFRWWETKYGRGSDLVHDPDCKKCK